MRAFHAFFTYLSVVDESSISCHRPFASVKARWWLQNGSVEGFHAVSRW